MPIDHSERARRHIVLARGYAEAARRVLAAELTGAERLAYFSLVAHGLELAMKAMLARIGYDEERLMLIGHDLHGCREALTRNRVDLAGVSNPQCVEILNNLAAPHALQCFRYPQQVREPLPDPTATLDLLHTLVVAAEARLVHT